MVRNKHYTVCLILTAFVVFFFSQSIVYAQDAIVTATEAPTVNITATPQIPSAGATVNLQLSSDTLDLSTANITWYVDGTAVQNGTNLITFSVKAKNDGSQTVVKAIAESPDGTSISASQTISPASVDLIVEPTSYVPPFYLGKALFANQGTARVIAIPHVLINGQESTPDNLIFRWTKDGIVLGSGSGINKNVLLVNGSVPMTNNMIAVDVLDATGNSIAQGTKVIPVSDPEIIFYEDSPLYGILYNKAIGNNYYMGNREELDIVAKPYFFNLASDAGNDSSYTWSVNGNGVAPSGKNNELIMKQTTQNLQGAATISLDLKNLDRIFQFASASFQVTFGI